MLQYDFCVYWALKSNESGELAYDNHGQPAHTDPVEIRCRWQDQVQEIIDPEGTRHMTKAKVYVESDVDVGGMLYHGLLSGLPSGYLSPREDVEDAWEIMRFEKLPELKYGQYLRTVYL